MSTRHQFLLDAAKCLDIQVPSKGLYSSMHSVCAGAHVMQIVIVISAYAGARLDQTLQPYVSIQDPATKATLCEYHLEDQDKASRRVHKNVVMCRFQRTVTQGWQVQAVGHMLPEGFAGDNSAYEPIITWIQSQPWHSS